jgi:hypothetical protein
VAAASLDPRHNPTSTMRKNGAVREGAWWHDAVRIESAPPIFALAWRPQSPNIVEHRVDRE